MVPTKLGPPWSRTRLGGDLAVAAAPMAFSFAGAKPGPSGKGNTESSWWSCLVAGGLGGPTGSEGSKENSVPQKRPGCASVAIGMPVPIGQPITLLEAISNDVYPSYREAVTACALRGGVTHVAHTAPSALLVPPGGTVSHELLLTMLNDLALHAGLQARLVDKRVREALAKMHADGVPGTDVTGLRCGLSHSTFRPVRRKPLLAWMRWYVQGLSAEHGVLPSAVDAAFFAHRADPIVRSAIQGLRGLVGSPAALGHRWRAIQPKGAAPVRPRPAFAALAS